MLLFALSDGTVMAQQSGSPVTTPESTKPAATHPVSKPDLAVAQELEKSGKVPEAFAEFRKWLDSNPDDPRYVKTLLHAAEIAPTIGQGLDLLKSGLTNVKNSDERSSLYAAMAATAELSGDIEHAQQYYELAYLEAPSGISRYEDLLRSAQLLFELGRLEESGSRVDLILSAVPAPQDSHEGGALRIAARLLAARIQRDKNGPLAGYEAARSLIDSSNAGPDVYLFVVESAFEAGKHAEAQAAFEALKKKYGQSPEVSLAASTLGARGANGRVGYMPSPSRVLAPVPANAAEKSAQTAAGGQVANRRPPRPTPRFERPENRSHLLRFRLVHSRKGTTPTRWRRI